jgi:hypothetical protein
MTVLPCSLQSDVNVCPRAGGGDGCILAKLLDLLDLAGQLGGKCLLQRLQLAVLACFPHNSMHGR